MRTLMFGLALALAFMGNASAQDRVDRNLQIMLEAARKMEWSDAIPDSRAYLLVKLETIRSPVALVFGYVDNRAACDQIADALTAARQVGAFECDGVY